jgi:hypothetical protein
VRGHAPMAREPHRKEIEFRSETFL